MRFIFSITLFYLGTTFIASAQQPMPPLSLSEIRDDIRKIENPDQKLKKYLEAGIHLLRRTPDSMLVVADEIMELQGVDLQEREAFALYVKARAWQYMDPDSAVEYANMASEKLKQIGAHDSFISIENMLAVQYTRNREYLQAESMYLNAINYAGSVEPAELGYPVHQIYGNLGNLYSMVGAHDLAIQMFEKFLQEEDNPAARCNMLMRLSNSFKDLGELKRARELLQPCLEVNTMPPPLKASVRSNLSEIYEEMGDADNALLLMEKASEISYKNRIPNIGISHLVELGNKYIAHGFIQQADSIQKLLSGNTLRRISPQQKVSKNLFYAELAFVKEDYNSTLKFLDQAIQIVGENNELLSIRSVHTLKAEAYEALGLTEKAIEEYKLQQRVDDLRFDEEAQRNLAMMSVRYQLQNKEDELLSMSNQLETTQSRVLFIILGLTILGLYVLYRYRIHYLLKEEKTRNRIARDLHDDLSGTLSSISFFSEAAQRVRTNPDEAGRFLGIIDKSATEAKEKINDIIWAIDPAKDDWSLFLKKCNRFAADVFDSNNITYKIDIDNTFRFPVELVVRQNLWLIFKECITNLSKHSNATEAGILFREKNSKIKLKIWDNGEGFNPDQIKNGHGLNNIRYRASAINGDAKLETNPGEGTTWSFEFNIG